jgi:predicted Zn finger-like uncharacterized protein
MNVACPQCTSVFRVDPAKVPPGGVRARCSVCSGIINVPEPSFEEPVAATPSSGWPGGQDSSWGRVPTPEGGWTPPPPAVPPAAPASATPPSSFTPPAQHTNEPGTAWPSPSGSVPATWGDWPSPDAGSAQEQPPNPWGDYGVNPLAPEMFSAPVQPPPSPPETPPPPDYTPPAPQPSAGSWESEPAEEYQAGLPAAQESAPAAEQPVETPSASGSHINPFLRRDPHERARRLARALASDIVTYYPEKHAEGMRDGTLRELFREEIKKSYDDYVAHVGAELARSTNYFQEALNEVLAGGKRLF